MYRLVTLTLAILLVSPAASGQIEMTSSSGGNVGIGVSPVSHTRLYVVNDGGSGFYGIRGERLNGGKSFGVYGLAQGTLWSYGIYGTTTGSSSKEYAGYFSGDVHATGTITSGSDAMFKENIRPLEGEEDSQERSILERFELLRPVAFTFSRDAPEYTHMNLPDGEQFGLIAQDVETIFPELVSDEIHPAAEETGEPITYKGLNYIQVVPILVHVVQEQQAEIDELRALIEGMGGGN